MNQTAMNLNQTTRIRPRLHLREWRKLRGFTQLELATRAGMDRDSIILYERPAHRPPWPRTVAKLALVLDVEPNQLWSLPPD